MRLPDKVKAVEPEKDQKYAEEAEAQVVEVVAPVADLRDPRHLLEETVQLPVARRKNVAP